MIIINFIVFMTPEVKKWRIRLKGLATAPAILTFYVSCLMIDHRAS